MLSTCAAKTVTSYLGVQKRVGQPSMVPLESETDDFDEELNDKADAQHQLEPHHDIGV